MEYITIEVLLLYCKGCVDQLSVNISCDFMMNYAPLATCVCKCGGLISIVCSIQQQIRTLEWLKIYIGLAHSLLKKSGNFGRSQI